MTTIRRIELLNLNDANEGKIALAIVGKSLKQAGPKVPIKMVIINDDTPEGKAEIEKRLHEGWKIKSIKN